jgi:hypothetical protein
MLKHHLQRSGRCFVWQMFEYSQDSTPLPKDKGQLPLDLHRMGGIVPPFSGSARSVPPLASLAFSISLFIPPRSSTEDEERRRRGGAA